MNDMVTARVPVEIKRQGSNILKEIGATTTQLVNAAFEYLIAEGKLPSPHDSLDQEAPSDRTATLHRMLPPHAIEELSASFATSTFEVPASYWQGRSCKEIIAEGKRADYEALA